MKITVNRRWAERLKKAGYDKDTVFSWIKCKAGLNTDETYWSVRETWEYENEGIDIIPAPTLSELWADLPYKVIYDGDEYALFAGKGNFVSKNANIDDVVNVCGYAKSDENGEWYNKNCYKFFFKTNMVDAIARLYLWVLTNGWIKEE